MSSENLSEGIFVDIQPPICVIPSRLAFEGLEEEDRIYAHCLYMSSFVPNLDAFICPP
jgi:hypothetical protein